jgi:hypothetical protein
VATGYGQPTTPLGNLQHFQGVSLHPCSDHAIDRDARCRFDFRPDGKSEMGDRLLHFGLIRAHF